LETPEDKVHKSKKKSSMFKKCSICPYESISLIECKYCFENFCPEHSAPLSNNDVSQGKKGHFCFPYEKKNPSSLLVETNDIHHSKKRQTIKSVSTRSFYKHPNKFISWFFWKKHPHNKLRKENFLIHLTIIIGLSLVFWVVYVNSNTLNEVVLWIFRLGALIQICLIIFIFRSSYKILVNLRYGIRGLANGFKFIAAIVFLLLCFQIYQQPGILTNSITQFNYGTFNPFEINWNYSNTGSTYDDGDSGNNQITIPEISNPKPVINIQELELSIHDLINSERQKNGIPLLQYDDKLADIARAHSQDMANRNYFDHNNPEGDGPTERAIKAGYPVHKELGGGWYSDGIAENIHKGWLYSQITYIGISTTYDWYTQAEIAYNCVNGWMNSPGHRQNILTSSYDKEGIGVSISNDYAVYVTQDFW